MNEDNMIDLGFYTKLHQQVRDTIAVLVAVWRVACCHPIEGF